MRNPFVRPVKPREGPTAFVLNVSLAGLGAMRSLGRAGVTVIGLDPDPGHAGFASRYCTALQCPHPVHEPDALLEFLLDQGRQLSEPGILSPASDAFTLFISRYRDELQDLFRFNLPTPEVMEATIDKRKLYELADRVGVPHATTVYPETMDDVLRIADQLDYPAYIKPYHSHLWQVAFPEAGKGIKVFSAMELVESFERVLDAGVQVMVQSIIVGPATNVQSIRVYVTAAGDIIAAFTNRKIRQFPVEFGRATLAESIHEPAFREMGMAFFRDIDYRGFGLIEFKRDDRDGILKLTDMNPRWLKTVNIATDSGIDFPLLHYRDLAGETPPPQFEFRSDVRWLDAVGDLASSWSLYRTGELTPWAWARSLIGVRSFAAFAMDDWGPFLREYQYGRRLLRVPAALARRR
ncbi:MAG TPA: hypothetical protein VGR08_08790 [Thermomicrobiales bacterium]|nr:hypothetical protein [Thermomicrobiales bacterium]